MRSILEHSAVVWHSSLTQKNTNALERVQKAAVKIIMGEKYVDYNDGLKNLNLESLQKRRENLCLRFARNCLKNEKVKGIFSKNESNHKMIKRKNNLYSEKLIKTKRYKNSAIPYMVRLLNKEEQEKKSIIENF